MGDIQALAELFEPKHRAFEKLELERRRGVVVLATLSQLRTPRYGYGLRQALADKGMAIEEGGEVTSGTHSPMLDRGIGLAYVPTSLAEPGEELTIDVRGRPRRARIVPKPIYKREESPSGGS